MGEIISRKEMVINRTKSNLDVNSEKLRVELTMGITSTPSKCGTLALEKIVEAREPLLSSTCPSPLKADHKTLEGFSDFSLKQS